VECAFLVQTGQASLGDFIIHFFAPTLLGNSVGGVVLVAALNYGQVVPGIERVVHALQLQGLLSEIERCAHDALQAQ
jgi:hypothetical protein